jgi:AcrR family transcriptional regulator
MLGSTRVPAARRKKARKRSYRPKKTPRQARAKATFESIVDAGARLLATRGYDALTTNHVAEAAGVAIGSLYEYFPDKETIVAEVARRTIRDVIGELAAALDQAARRDPAAGLRDLVRSCA